MIISIFKNLMFFITYALLIFVVIYCIGLATKDITFIIPTLYSIAALSGIICIHICTIKMDRWLLIGLSDHKLLLIFH